MIEINITKYKYKIELIFWFLKKNRFLFQCSNKKLLFTQVDSINIAKDMAWEEYFYVLGKNDFTWTDIRLNELSYINSIIYKLQNRLEVEFEIKKILSFLEKEIDLWVGKEYYDIVEDVFLDFSGFIKSRFLTGHDIGVFKKIFTVYESGGWPCGWDGNYPEGNLIVFYPPSPPLNTM